MKSWHGRRHEFEGWGRGGQWIERGWGVVVNAVKTSICEKGGACMTPHPPAPMVAPPLNLGEDPISDVLRIVPLHLNCLSQHPIMIVGPL